MSSFFSVNSTARTSESVRTVRGMVLTSWNDARGSKGHKKNPASVSGVANDVLLDRYATLSVGLCT